MKSDSNTAFDLVSDMEDDVTAVEDFSLALWRLGDGLDKDDGRAIQRIAITLRTHCDAIAARRKTLSCLLHPATPGADAIQTD